MLIMTDERFDRVEDPVGSNEFDRLVISINLIQFVVDFRGWRHEVRDNQCIVGDLCSIVGQNCS